MRLICLRSAKGFAVAIVNLDGMKPINDLFGFEGGNDLIRQCSMRLRAAIEDHGFVFRYEGDEFAFLLPNTGTEKEVLKIGKLLQDVLLAPFDVDGTSARLSGSFGFAIYPNAGDSFDKVIANIETALYHSKRKGRGRLTIYSPDIEKTVRENAVLGTGPAPGNFGQCDFATLPTDHFTSGWLLCSDLRLLPAGSILISDLYRRPKFIPLAEERGIIAQLTDALLMQASATAAEWPDDLFLVVQPVEHSAG